MKFLCPECKKNVGIDGSGRYECPYCNKSFFVSEETASKLLKTAMSSTTAKKRTFHIAYLWIISIVFILISLTFFSKNFFSGLMILLSGAIIFPPIKNLYSKVISLRLRYILIFSFILFSIGLGISPKEYNTKGFYASETQRLLPVETQASVDDPHFSISYNCANVRKVEINKEELSESQINMFCNQQYKVNLKAGDNIFSLIIISRRGKIEENLKIIFDEKAYTARLAKEKAEAQAAKIAREKAAAEAKAAEAKAKEAELNSYATKYCKYRKTNNRKFGKLVLSDSNISAKFSQGTIGKYLTTAKCRALTDFVIALMTYRDGSINKELLDVIIKGNYQMGMDKYYFFAAVGNPDDINTSQYGTSYTTDQIIYYKDSYHISAQYFYFDNDILTSTQDF